MKQRMGYYVFLIWLLGIGTACSSRQSTAEYDSGSTRIYRAKNPEGIEASITLCRKIQESTGLRIGEGHVFALGESNHIRAFIDLKNRFNDHGRPLMFHVDWVDPDENSIYQKRIGLQPDDTTTTLYSSLSLAAGKRDTGNYTFRVYFFRELIAEKEFKIVPEDLNRKLMLNGMDILVTLYRKIDKKTGEMTGIDSAFDIGKKAWVRARIDLSHRFHYGHNDLSLKLEWIDPDGKSFYSKNFSAEVSDSIVSLSSAISIAPEKRLPGKYALRIYLFDDLLHEKSFDLR